MKYQNHVLAASIGILIGALAWLTIQVPRLIAAPPPVQQATILAQQGLPRLLQLLNETGYAEFGFRDADELKRATLGTPYQVYLLAPGQVRAYQPGQRLRPLLTEQNWWEFPVLVNGQARSFLTVAEQHGHLEVVGIGASGHSPKVQALREQIADGSASITLVRLLQVHGLFALVEQDGREELVYIHSSPQLFPTIDTQGLTRYPPEQMLPAMAQALQQVTR